LTSDKKKSSSFKKAVGLIFTFLLTGLFLVIAFYGVDFSRMLFFISNASVFWIVILVISLFISHYIRAMRWKIILNSVKPDASTLNLFGALMVGYGVNCAVPRLGEVSRAVMLGRWEKISTTSTIGTVILERVIDILSFAFAVVISVLIWSGDLYQNFPWLRNSLYIVIVLMLIVILFLILIVRLKEKFYNAIIGIVGKISEKLALKLASTFEMLILGFASLKGVKNYSLTLLLTLLMFVFYWLNSYIGFYIVGMDQITNVNLGMAWIVMSISSIGVMIPTPGGTGSYHTLVKSVLVLLFGFDEAISLAYAVLTHIISYILFVVTALFFFFYLNNKFAVKSI